MKPLQGLLAGELKPGIYVLQDPIDANRFRTMLEQNGYNFFYLDGQVISNEERFFAEAKIAYAFPFFGENWDAFDDCIRDMSWLPSAKGNVTLYDEFQKFALGSPDDFRLAFYGLRLGTRAHIAQPMYVFLRGDKSVLPLSDVDGILSGATDVDNSGQAE